MSTRPGINHLPTSLKRSVSCCRHGEMLVAAIRGRPLHAISVSSSRTNPPQTANPKANQGLT